MDLHELDYNLPESLIAQTPVEPRDNSRLLVMDRKSDTLEHRIFRDIIEYLQPGDLLIANESRVIPARLYGFKQGSGGKVEILLLHKLSDRCWKTLVGGARTRENTNIQLYQGTVSSQTPSNLTCRVLDTGQRGERTLEFSEPVEEYLEMLGTVPLPPYIHQPLIDQERYQTVYAKTLGSAAAPTAGLHFTPDLLLKLREMDIDFGTVTLHIGLDTFRPISETVIEDHLIHQEWSSLSLRVAEQINRTKIAGGRVVAVGTTSVRVLETAARHGILQSSDEQCPWHTVAPFEGFTDLYITPGFHFRVVDVLLTNFHLPRSSLLALVMAFAGQTRIKHAYREAIKEKYRFYSFGDAMLIL
jgi:S-adenosylmethionine:tRNA ribosyltransferase-isomerase